jgi:septum formation protein
MTRDVWLAEALRRPLVLASESPRRREILAGAGVPFEVQPGGEEPTDGGPQAPAARVVYLATAKAQGAAVAYPGRLVIGADTLVALGSRVMGKPADEAEARAMLGLLSGRQHEVHTGLAIALGGTTEILETAVETSRVAFHRLSREWIEGYIASGEPFDKAGAYGIQSGGGELVAEVLGSYLNVVGLPLAKLLEALSALGWAPADCEGS